jgi:hypothetical protein
MTAGLQSFPFGLACRIAAKKRLSEENHKALTFKDLSIGAVKPTSILWFLAGSVDTVTAMPAIP